MLAKLAGAAVAAVVSLGAIVGGVQRAEAAQIDAFDISVEGFISDGSYSGPTFINFGFQGFSLYRYTTVSIFYPSIGPASAEIEFLGNSSLGFDRYQIKLSNYSPLSPGDDVPAYFNEATTDIQITPKSTGYTQFNLSSITDIKLQYTNLKTGVVSVEKFQPLLAVGEIYFVPLPSSAPMFGAALLTLAGAAAWRSRRA